MGTLALAILGCVLVCQASRSSHSREQERHSRLSLLKEISNKIDHGPAYVSHHKGDLPLPSHQVLTKHAWKHNKKTGLTKKSKKPSKKMDKMYKKMIEKEKLRLKKKYLKKT